MTSADGVRVAIIGPGFVGEGVARRLAALPSVETVVLLGGSNRRRERLAASIGVKAQVAIDDQSIGDIDIDIDVVVVCSPDETQFEYASAGLAAGLHVVTLADSARSIEQLLGLEEFAVEIGRSVVIGAGASPGLSSILATHAASLFDDVDEISVAVAGAGGPTCNDRRTRAARGDSQEWRDGAWVDVSAKSGTELVWFPDPVGSVDCSRGDLTEPRLLSRHFEDVGLIAAKLGRGQLSVRTRLASKLRNRVVEETGGVRVAVSGRIESVPSTVVYGCSAGLGRVSSVTASTAAIHVCGEDLVGARAMFELIDPPTMLRAMAAASMPCSVYDGND